MGWGRYPRQMASVLRPKTKSACRDLLQQGPWIARGLGRSYGDSSLNDVVVQTDDFDHFLDFDSKTGVLTAEAGVSLRSILNLVTSAGWFLPVTPGTSFVTLGGAIASDVHGKNHHVAGCFGEHVLWIEMLLGTGEIVRCSTRERSDLFFATCGGMGLTGQILSASIQLIPIVSSFIDQEIFRAHSLEEVCDLFDQHQSRSYSVAWIDCLTTGKRMGRSLLMLGEHSQEGGFTLRQKSPLRVPVEVPSFVLNPHSVSVFNEIYYRFPRRQKSLVPLSPFFYPLDSVLDWNRFYGREGFVQYQFVIPTHCGQEPLRRILQKIADNRNASFLAVLKKFGRQNQNILSFPFEGFTLALDFKVSASTMELFRDLDDIVSSHEGRWYLAKDAVMSEKSFKRGYSRWEEFQNVRKKYGAMGNFTSRQAGRLGLQ